jgi:hypothetical protein
MVELDLRDVCERQRAGRMGICKSSGGAAAQGARIAPACVAGVDALRIARELVLAGRDMVQHASVESMTTWAR